MDRSEKCNLKVITPGNPKDHIKLHIIFQVLVTEILLEKALADFPLVAVLEANKLIIKCTFLCVNINKWHSISNFSKTKNLFENYLSQKPSDSPLILLNMASITLTWISKPPNLSKLCNACSFWVYRKCTHNREKGTKQEMILERVSYIYIYI
jgi:hypothetical protein